MTVAQLFLLESEDVVPIDAAESERVWVSIIDDVTLFLRLDAGIVFGLQSGLYAVEAVDE